MGLIRGALNVATFGAVASRSKKQRTAAMTLAAIQGKSDREVQTAGGRSFDAVNRANARSAMTYDQRQAQETVRRQMKPYLKKGVIEPEDLDNPEVRLRKIMAYEGVSPELIDQRIARWKQEVERLRREGKIL